MRFVFITVGIDLEALKSKGRDSQLPAVVELQIQDKFQLGEGECVFIGEFQGL